MKYISIILSGVLHKKERNLFGEMPSPETFYNYLILPNEKYYKMLTFVCISNDDVCPNNKSNLKIHACWKDKIGANANSISNTKDYYKHVNNAMIIRKRICFERSQDYSRKNNVIFEKYIYARPDLIFFRNIFLHLPITNIYLRARRVLRTGSISRDYLVGPHCGWDKKKCNSNGFSCMHFDDQFAVIPNRFALSYFYFYKVKDKINKTILWGNTTVCEECNQKLEKTPEKVFTESLLSTNVPYEIYPFRFRIFPGKSRIIENKYSDYSETIESINNPPNYSC